MTDHAALVKAKAAAEELIASLVGAGPEDLVRALKPRPDDYAKVFVASAAEAAKAGYASMWSSPPERLAKPEQTQVHAAVADSSMLAGTNEHSRSFPGGYQKIAHLLRPGLVWVAFQLVAPGQADGMSFDGLVFVDDHWAWFPKPWRVLPADDAN